MQEFAEKCEKIEEGVELNGALGKVDLSASLLIASLHFPTAKTFSLFSRGN